MPNRHLTFHPHCSTQQGASCFHQFWGEALRDVIKGTVAECTYIIYGERLPYDGYVLTVLARLHAPPFLHRSSAKKKGGGRLIEVCTNALSLRPPPPPPRNAKSGFRVTVMLLCAAHAESRGCHKITIIIGHNSQQLQTRDGRIVGHVPLELARLSGTQLGYLPNNRCTKTIRRQRTGCSLCLHLPRQDKSQIHLEKLITIFPSTSYVPR